MFKQSLRPISRTLPRGKSSLRQTHLHPVRFNSINNGSPKQSSNGLIVPLGVAALAIGGFAMYYVPLVHDNDDRAESKQAKPNTLKALSPYQGDVRKSVLDQDSLKEPLHKSSHGATPSAKDKEVSTNIPSVVEDKASEAQEPAQTAFNEETGEINWDCPCLGGMADGPCGEQFKAAFSCFIYSEKEPKGVECVDKFQGMQDCFRQHPDIYGEEIDDDEEGYHPESVGNAGGEIDKEAIDPRPDSQKNRKMEPVKRTPPPDLGHHKMNQDNSVKGVAKLVPSKNRADKVDAPGNTSSGENTVPKEQKKRSGNDE